MTLKNDGRQVDPYLKIEDIGEKKLIETFIKPLFNPSKHRNSIGDDCAALEVEHGSLILISTDRVPSDLISFQAGVLDFEGLGRYLGVLNLSDIAACGGVPLAVMFNCGLPANLLLQNFLNICIGLQSITKSFGVGVVGGDVTSSSELSLSASVVGHVKKELMLRRAGANAGDSVFVSRPIGLTPVALDYCMWPDKYRWLSRSELNILEGQFKDLEPEIALGRQLSESGYCTSCMDNTDGLGQSLMELAQSSECSFQIKRDALQLPELVVDASRMKGYTPVQFALGPGADFGLVGTLAGSWTNQSAGEVFNASLRIIGEVMSGSGVFIRDEDVILPLNVPGWSYFRS